MRSHKGFFITFEKTKEGLGGTTQVHHLAENLRKAGFEVVVTREPGGTPVGQELRRLLLHEKQYNLSKATELFLMVADRSQHYKEVLKPALKEGKIVISDRYFDSTLVYQGNGRGWKNAFLWRLHQASTGSLLPDLTFVLDGEAHRQRNSDDRIEDAGDKFHSRVADGMRHLVARNQGNRYVGLDGNLPEKELAKKVFDTVLGRMASYGTDPVR